MSHDMMLDKYLEQTYIYEQNVPQYARDTA